LDYSSAHTAPILCGKCPNLIAPASLQGVLSPITSIVRVDFTARLLLRIIHAFAEILSELPFSRPLRRLFFCLFERSFKPAQTKTADPKVSRYWYL
jgi:hypothetical protein